jgi:hypothetical protein
MDWNTMLMLHASDRATETPQASSTRYFLRVVTIVVVTSVITVPKSSRSVCCARVEDCRVCPSSYEGREPEPSVSDDDTEGVSRPSTFTGINFQMNQGMGSVSVQTTTWVKHLAMLLAGIAQHPTSVLVPHGIFQVIFVVPK